MTKTIGDEMRHLAEEYRHKLDVVEDNQLWTYLKVEDYQRMRRR